MSSTNKKSKTTPAASAVVTRSQNTRSPPSTSGFSLFGNLLGKSSTTPAKEVEIIGEDPSGDLALLNSSSHSTSSSTSAASLSPLSMDLPTTDPVLKSLMLKLMGMVTDIDKKISTKIDVLSSSVDSIKRQIDVELTQRITTNESNLVAHSSRLDTVEAAISELRNEAEAATKVNDLLIKGVPMLRNDNPINLYCRIATTVGYAPEEIPHAEVFRLGKKTGTGADPPILVKFISTRDRNTFYRKYFQHRSLNLSEIGFASNTRVYITENLTGHNLEIYKAALTLRNEKKLFSVSTSHGTVMIRFKDGDKPVEAKTLAALSNISQQ
jgi:hypothetical protein